MMVPVDQDVLSRIDELSYDIAMSLRAGMVVSRINEYELFRYLDELPRELLQQSPSFRELLSVMAEYDGDEAWNLVNELRHFDADEVECFSGLESALGDQPMV